MEPDNSPAQPIAPTPQQDYVTDVHHSTIGQKIFFALACMLLILALGAAVYSLTKTKRVTGLEVAVRTASFLDKHLLEDGTLPTSFICEETLNDKCVVASISEKPQAFEHVGILYSLLAEQTGSQVYAEVGSKIAGKALADCTQDAAACERYLVLFSHLYKKTGEESYASAMMRAGDTILSRADAELVATGLSQKLALLYGVSGEEGLKGKLVALADAELAALESTSFLRGIHLAWALFIPAYEVTGDVRYLAATEQVFANRDAAAEIEFRESRGAAAAFKAVESLMVLGASNLEYVSQAKNLLQGFVAELWDAPERVLYTGDNGFINMQVDPDLTEKITFYNGRIGVLFATMGEEKFKMPLQ